MKIIRARHMAAAEMAGVAAPRGGPFAESSFWKTPLLADAPLHANSDQWRINLCAQLNLSPDTGAPIAGAQPGAASFQTSACAAPLYVVPEWVPLQTVRLTDHALGWQDLEAVWLNGVPLPPGWQANNCSDKHVCVWDPFRDTYHEFWKLTTDPDGVARARWGGTMYECSTNHGRFVDSTSPLQHRLWGATGTSLPLTGGLVQYTEVASGLVDHAIPLVLAHAGSSTLYPAQRDDSDKDATWIPEGARVRFPADVDLGRVKGNALCLAEAIRDYGAVTMDKTGAGVALKFRDNSIGGGWSWRSLFPDFTYTYMWSLPWHKAQIVDPSVSLPLRTANG